MPNFFFNSALPVGQNAMKNILFRGATVMLNIFVYRLFAFMAFKKQDYTSYLMFAEDIIQKALFTVSRRFNRQALLVALFTSIMAAAGFYDTLLWALDSPGYITKSTWINADQLSSQLLDSPAYTILLSGPMNNLSHVNINDTIGANLYVTGLNFTLPGINAPGLQEVVTPSVPLDISVPPSIWLDSDGFAVGPDNDIMFTPDMNTSETFCAPSNVGPEQQTWLCKVRNRDAEQLFAQPMGRPQIWWDVNTSEYLIPSRKDNLWGSLSTGGDTAVMKQVFTVTKGNRRHTFLHTTFKATMISFMPDLLNDGEITEFMRRTLPSSDPSQVSPVVQALVDYVIESKNNKTSLTMGSFMKIGNVSVTSISTDYLSFPGSLVDDSILFASLRFVSSTIQLLRSEDIPNPPTPFGVCDRFYTNIAAGGIVRSSNCYSAYAANHTQNQSRFLGQIDTSSVFIISNIIGDGTKNTSISAIDPIGVEWYNQNVGIIDNLLISRGLILGGVAHDVKVDVLYHEAAISCLQLFLILLPFILAAVTLAATFKQPMSYFASSFLAAVCATTRMGNSTCEEVGYMRSPPEISLKTTGGHVVLKTGKGDVLTSVGKGQVVSSSYSVDYITEPLLLDQEVDHSQH
ncbi:hypothetical protein GALMADRAFT_237885 [Galerina marginata CBS 339.88]|uniref:Transmembrane protein n=1 Tax=Galerina marginata (strain CBS 339.88) TaxID=685588 RepID=A0A067TJP1_GALM3|nr:hypothetical protein GALMADRAFT_237885 [Galerina marginata CBS 339.88]